MPIPVATGTTGTYSFAPSAADTVLHAYGMLQIRRPELTTSHLEDAAFHANMLMVDLTNRLPHRWLEVNQTIPLVLNQATYNLAPNTVAVTISYLSLADTSDRVIGPISQADYMAIPQKTLAAPPTSIFFKLGIPPSITLWPVPDTYTISQSGSVTLMTWRQMQDVDLSNGNGFDSPYRYLDAISTGLAARLAASYRPEREATLNAAFEARLARAMKRDQESVPLSIAPMFGGYYS
jgi:hypothetical protein